MANVLEIPANPRFGDCGVRHYLTYTHNPAVKVVVDDMSRLTKPTMRLYSGYVESQYTAYPLGLIVVVVIVAVVVVVVLVVVVVVVVAVLVGRLRD
jgi:hypothetical protein